MSLSARTWGWVMRGVWKLGSWAFQDVVIMSPYTVSLTMDRLIGKFVIFRCYSRPLDSRGITAATKLSLRSCICRIAPKAACRKRSKTNRLQPQQVLKHHGFDDMETLMSIQDEHMREMSIPTGHILKLKRRGLLKTLGFLSWFCFRIGASQSLSRYVFEYGWASILKTSSFWRCCCEQKVRHSRGRS